MIFDLSTQYTEILWFTKHDVPTGIFTLLITPPPTSPISSHLHNFLTVRADWERDTEGEERERDRTEGGFMAALLCFLSVSRLCEWSSSEEPLDTQYASKAISESPPCEHTRSQTSTAHVHCFLMSLPFIQCWGGKKFKKPFTTSWSPESFVRPQVRIPKILNLCVRRGFVPTSTQLRTPPGAFQNQSVMPAWCCWLAQIVFIYMIFPWCVCFYRGVSRLLR